MLSVAFPSSSLALCSVEQRLNPSPSRVFPFWADGSFVTVIAACHGTKAALQASTRFYLLFLVSRVSLHYSSKLFFDLSSDLFLVRCVLCRQSVITSYFLSVFALRLCGCGPPSVDQATLLNLLRCTCFVKFCYFTFFLKQKHFHVMFRLVDLHSYLKLTQVCTLFFLAICGKLFLFTIGA